MIAATLLLLSLLTAALAIVDDGDHPPRPIDPLPKPRPRPCPPTCDNVYCPKGYHCELLQHTFCIKAPCNFPKYPTCVPNMKG